MRTTTAAFMLLVTCAAWAQDQYDIKVYPCPRAEGGIVIDGVLSDPGWERAPVVDEFTVYNQPEPIEPQTMVAMAWDDAAFYLGVVSVEPNMERMAPVRHARDSMEVFHGETIEVFLDPDHDHQAYFQIAINAAGSIYDSVRTDPSWNSEATVATRLGEGSWALEVAVPWAKLGVAPAAGAVVGVNVCRDRYLGANKQWSNWSQTAANFHDPDRFGHAVLSPSARQLGELEAEYRRGGRAGAIVFLGPDTLMQAAYRELGRHALAGADGLLTELEEAIKVEEDEATRAELARRLEAYQGELKEFAALVASDRPVAREQWRRMTFRLGEIRLELDRVVWEARLAALLAGI